MRGDVSSGIEELKRQFEDSVVTAREDGQGGAYVLIDPVTLGPSYTPPTTWIGFHIPAQYPYADIYPVFIGEEIARSDGTLFQPPVTRGHTFEERPAIQVSRRNAAAQNGLQKVPAKILKILDFLRRLAS